MDLQAVRLLGRSNSFGLQRLADIAQTKEPFVYRVYPEAERQKDPTKEDVLRIRNTCEIGNKGGHGFGLGLGMDVEGWLERAIRFYEGL